MKISVYMMVVIVCIACSAPVFAAKDLDVPTSSIDKLVGEHLAYDISFLWFDRVAVGSLALTLGDTPGTYLVTLEARTLGLAAFVTRERIAKYQTLMVRGDKGQLYPVWHSLHDIRGEGDSRKERSSKYSFDFKAGKVRYQKQKNGKVYADRWFLLESNKPVYDILTALYNLRLGFFGAISHEPLLIPTFHHKGLQNIIVEPVDLATFKDRDFFSGQRLVAKILVDPSVFGTRGRDIYACFDSEKRPSQGIIKNVIGLGDVRGTLRSF